jgi:hypothetical protein
MPNTVVQDALRELEGEAGVADGFFRKLLDEDDWSFVLKFHALVEAALSRALTDHLGHPALVDVFAATELSDKRKGKLAFARALDILDPHERAYVSTLSELRNAMVHDVRNVGLSLHEYLKRIDEKRVRAMFRTLDLAPDGGPWRFKSGSMSRKDVFLANPKLVIWVFGSMILASLHAKKRAAVAKREFEKTAAAIVEQLGAEPTEEAG